ncbi:hypothetical protein IW140_003694 [Coemansia sp. RSA 1813]|nr:hypothetical protein EV178_002659 [Coemansia sp. RSA 1646]KAJ1766469.1 hypothetical protein LPJ74_005870 [Coemansia sp. RSA 1843]KAJ2088759.1 hypothetical protein IW138_003931 [Coemansia sp. RSA 986]KAJ2213694.1 hypothetical protein EV179_003592 [Coemansia sp. RSA 487]KAJ2568703.1 hypothetical protein IW140_003694 [Coemansia sp. RSA 1813]
MSAGFYRFAFIDFNNSSEATLARSKLHNTKIRGYLLEVHFDNKVPQQFYGLLDDRYNEDGGESPGYSPLPRPRNSNEGQEDRSTSNRTSKYSSEYNERAPAGSTYKDYDAVDEEPDRRVDDDRASGGYPAPYRQSRRPSPTNYSDDRRQIRSSHGSRKYHPHQQPPFPSKRAAYHPYGPQGRDRRQHRQRQTQSPPPPPPPMLPPHSSPNRNDEYYRRPRRDEYYDDEDDSSSRYSDIDRPDSRTEHVSRHNDDYDFEDIDSAPYSRERPRSHDRTSSNGSPKKQPKPMDISSNNPGGPVPKESASSGNLMESSTRNNKSGADSEFNEDILFSGP